MSNAVATPMGSPTFHAFRSERQMFTTLAEDIAARLTSALARHGRASLVAAGGSTPGPLYDALARHKINWSRVSVTLSDERWIDASDDGSNEKLVRTRLLVGEAASAQLVPLKTAHPHASDAVEEVQAAVAAMPRPFDIVLLGMGTDGHIASLIPHAEGLAAALDRHDPALVRAVNPPNLAAMGERLTLTLPAILDARAIYLLIKGEAKNAAYQRALAGSDMLEAPVRSVLQQAGTPVSVFWSASDAA
jgi:6-phosphogluconolactonase